MLARDMDTDAACTSCHPAIGQSAAAHTHHRPDSVGSRCVNCHMPHTVYGLLKGIRNHRIDSPKVTGLVGANERPNACNLCHLDRGLGWTAQQLERWYHQPAPAGLPDETPAVVEWLLSGDAVLRALAAWHTGWDDARKTADATAAVPYLVTALDDPYAAVRYVAGHALQAILPGVTYDYLAAPALRQQQATAILQRWLTDRGDHRPSAQDAAAIDARIKRLVEQRDNTPVRAME
jgi:hypothetical protein